MNQGLRFLLFLAEAVSRLLPLPLREGLGEDEIWQDSTLQEANPSPQLTSARGKGALRWLFLAAAMLGVVMGGCETAPILHPEDTMPEAAVAPAQPDTPTQPDEQELLAQAQRYEQLRKPQPLPQPQPSHQDRPTGAAPTPTPTPTPTAQVKAAPAPTAPAPALQRTEHPRPTPAPAPKPLTRKQLAEKLTGQLNADLSGSGAMRPYLQRAAMSVIEPRFELTEADLVSLAPGERKLVLQYQRMFTRLGRELGNSSAEDRELLIDAATSLAEQIERERPLSIRTVKLCKRVTGFGVYDTLPGRSFLVGRTHPMIVYAELDHFTSRVDAGGDHVVKLTQELVLYNESDGLAVWRQAPVKIVDTSRNRRRDFFVVQIIRLSDRLTVGKYMLKLSVTDEQGKQVDEASIPIQIVADPKLTIAPR